MEAAIFSASVSSDEDSEVVSVSSLFVIFQQKVYNFRGLVGQWERQAESPTARDSGLLVDLPMK